MTYKHSTAPEQDKQEQRRTDAKQSIEQATLDLMEEIKAGKSQHYLDVLAFCAQFHHYSQGNQNWLASQARRRGIRISHVAGYRAWEELGYQVMKGAEAFWVLAPAPFKKTETDKKTGQEVEKTIPWFKAVPVFDASQIAQGINERTGEPYKKLTQFFAPLPSTEEAQALYEALSRAAQAEGFTVQEEELGIDNQGYSLGKKIVTKRGLDSTSKFCTAVHELTHGKLHQNGSPTTRDKNGKECEAEATAYVVALHFGIRNPYSADYLQMYSTDVKALETHLEVVQKTAHEIILMIEKARVEELVAA